jgi:hypothetical protein
VRVEDAPSAGWYPDPEGGSRLRFWEGTDWSDRYRAPPTAGVVAIQEAASQAARAEFDNLGGHVSMGNLSRNDSEQIISQVRQAARDEANRAAEMFGQQARSISRDLTPLITQYTSKFIKWFRILSVIAILLLIGWVVFQIFAQVSLFDWVGERIDNITDNVGENSAIFDRGAS